MKDSMRLKRIPEVKNASIVNSELFCKNNLGCVLKREIADKVEKSMTNMPNNIQSNDEINKVIVGKMLNLFQNLKGLNDDWLLELELESLREVAILSSLFG